MSWLYETRRFRSEKNGDILCRRLFGRWEVFVGGYHESSRYLVAMWRGAYRRLPKEPAVRDVLMLGLAAGDNVALLGRRFPGCRVTVVEWDPVMVEIAGSLGGFRDGARPEIILGDAAAVLPGLGRAFDLVIVDIFTGGAVALAAHEETFFGRVSDRLRPGGLVIVNAFWEPRLLEAAGRRLEPVAVWKGLNNHMGIFRRPCAPTEECATVGP